MRLTRSTVRGGRYLCVDAKSRGRLRCRCPAGDVLNLPQQQHLSACWQAGVHVMRAAGKAAECGKRRGNGHRKRLPCRRQDVFETRRMFTVGEDRGLLAAHVDRRGVEVGEEIRVDRLGCPPGPLGRRLRGADHAHLRLLGMRDCRRGRDLCVCVCVCSEKSQSSC